MRGTLVALSEAWLTQGAVDRRGGLSRIGSGAELNRGNIHEVERSGTTTTWKSGEAGQGPVGEPLKPGDQSLAVQSGGCE